MFKVYVEAGKKRTFAGAIDWPGWSRSGKDEGLALQALVDYGKRYARVLRGSPLTFVPPNSPAELKVVERLTGDATTDFGAPVKAPAVDLARVDQAELKRQEAILEACWRYFEAAAKKAQGKRLRTGPRGGGRDLQAMLEHVLRAERAYLGAMGWKVAQDKGRSMDQEAMRVREATLHGMEASARGEIPPVGPRGRKRWTVRFFVRRAAWHLLDHAWELEDRVE